MWNASRSWQPASEALLPDLDDPSLAKRAAASKALVQIGPFAARVLRLGGTSAQGNIAGRRKQAGAGDGRLLERNSPQGNIETDTG